MEQQLGGGPVTIRAYDRSGNTMATTPLSLGNSREQLVHALYEAAELEHNLMCTYLYAAFSLKRGEGEGLNAAEASAVERWRSSIIQVAVGEMGHLAAVWQSGRPLDADVDGSSRWPTPVLRAP